MNIKSIIDFVGELVGRLFSANPKFFKIVQLIAGIFAALGGLVATGIIPAGTFLSGLNSGLAYAIELTTAILSQLPNPNPPTTTSTK